MLNGTRDVLLRFNQKIGWYFSGHIALGYNVTRFNTLPQVPNDYADIKNTYKVLQMGGNFNLLTAIRTRKKGGRIAIGDREILLKHVKIYLCAGAEFMQLKEAEDSLSFKRITNLYGGLGLEIYRLGKHAKQKYGALVPFFELRYFIETGNGYYASPKGFVHFDKIPVSAGLKYTFGLPESK